MDIWDKIFNNTASKNEALQIWYKNADKGIYTLKDIKKEVDCDVAQLKAYLEAMEKHNLLKRVCYHQCVYCGKKLVNDEVERHNCIEDGEVNTKLVYKYKVLKERSKDVTWMIAIHGMNTDGAWQQDFNWKLSNIYKYSVPVYIYKYGNIKIKPLLYFRKKRQALKFANVIRGRQKEIGLDKPDIIAHSYGTLLLSEILSDSKYDDIKVGRIILVGSIVRPNYNWEKIIKSGRVESVMCHHSKKDRTVLVAQFGIPGSGPSGNVGFNDKKSVHHVSETSFGHSDYFTKANQSHVINNYWQPFLTQSSHTNNINHHEGYWKPSVFRFITHPVKIILLLCLSSCIFIALPLMIYFGFDPAVDEIKNWFVYFYQKLIE